jgi:ABC-type uncharacterized transport system substrate-binding protein
MKRILAVAIGTPDADFLVNTSNPANVRPYVTGLVEGLSDPHGPNKQIGTDYDIWYRERSRLTITSDAATFGPGTDGKANDLIFPMSTTVLQNAVNFTGTTSIVYPSVSNPASDGIHVGNNVAGINAKRDTTADKCLDYFIQSMSPPLQTVYYLHSQHYPPAERARGRVEHEAGVKGIHFHRVDVTEKTLHADLMAKVPMLDPSNPTVGVLVLPIDFCLGERPTQAPDIISTVQGTKGLPTFFPIPDWARASPPAFGAYGVSQSTCGELAAPLVFQIMWNGASPKTIGPVDAPDDAFEWVLSQPAIDELKIKLPERFRGHVIKGGEHQRR